MKTIWKGSITFGLVNIPIQLYSATESHALGFTLLHATCHTPLNYHRWCPHCDKEVSWDDTVKGIETSKGMVIVTKEILKELHPEKTETISIVEFVNTDAVPPIYLSQHYYVAPLKKKDTAFALFMKALAKLKKVAIGRFVMRDKEYTCMLQPYEEYLLLTTLHYTYEIRNIANLEVSSKVAVTTAELQLAQELIEKLSVKKFDMSKFKDTFAQNLKKLIEKPPKKVSVVKERTTKARKKPSSLSESLRASLRKKPTASRQPVARA